MKHLVLIIVILSACGTQDTNSGSNLDAETAEMAQLLKDLNENGDPLLHYHWNHRLAEMYKEQLAMVPDFDKIEYWSKYCRQLLNAGENQQCINEIENYLEENDLKYSDLLTPQSFSILETLGLAYLRLGEVNNCLSNHNEHSCILPLREEAFHLDKMGSKKAIEIFSLINNRVPSDKYKWLLNVAYMTLGDYPENVPEEYFIQYPNWEKETKDFPPFKEIAMKLGVAEDAISGGTIVDDFNNDGLIDIFATSYDMADQCKLFLNTGAGFRDATEESGLIGIVSGLNCKQADYNNDGNLDILILRGGWLGEGGQHPNSLLRNNGDGTFSDVSKSSGLFSLHPTQTAEWADVNLDGYLDLFIGNESNPKNEHPCELFINQQDGTFKEQAAEFGLGSILGFVKGVTFGDINNDKWPDLYISVMGGSNLLYKNENGKFIEIGEAAGVQNPVYSFPCWFWDVNNDGFEDLFVSSYDTRSLVDLAGVFARGIQGEVVVAEKSSLFINNGDGTFSDQNQAYNIDLSLYTMGSNFGDLDNDGWLDFYAGTGAPDFSTIIPNRMFRNKGGEQFEEVTSAGRFGHIQKGHGVGFADFDMDGDQDIYTVMGGALEGDNFSNILFENPISENNWIVVHLQGTTSNRSAIGTSLKLELDNGRTIYHTINSGSSFGANSLQAEVGIGKAQAIRSLTILWTNSDPQVFKDLTPNKKYLIIEGQNELSEQAYVNFEMTGDEMIGMHHE